jgi:hypothetical protein
MLEETLHGYSQQIAHQVRDLEKAQLIDVAREILEAIQPVSTYSLLG